MLMPSATQRHTTHTSTLPLLWGSEAVRDVFKIQYDPLIRNGGKPRESKARG